MNQRSVQGNHERTMRVKRITVGLATAVVVAVIAAGCGQPDPPTPVVATQTTAQQPESPWPTTPPTSVTPPSTRLVDPPEVARHKWEACFELANGLVADPTDVCGPSPDPTPDPDPAPPDDTGGEGCYDSVIDALNDGAPIGPSDPRLICEH
jgi:hypothetical protein